MIGQNATIRVTMAGEETGNVLININGINYTAKIKDKIAILNVNLPVNDYTVNVSYMGDDKYNATELANATVFEVYGKQNATVEITADWDHYATLKFSNSKIIIFIAFIHARVRKKYFFSSVFCYCNKNGLVILLKY